MCENLHKIIDEFWTTRGKNVLLLEEIEYICDQMKGLRITFCKSGKDRTGMSVTLSNVRTVDNHLRGGASPEEKILREMAVMRTHGVRLRLIEKNVGEGAKSFAINAVQSQFLPLLYRPPPETLCEILTTKNET